MKRSNKFIKVLMVVLSLTLVFGAVAIVAGASSANVAEVDGVGYATVEDAIEAAEAGSTVKLAADALVSSAIGINKNLTIDLNGYSLESSAEVLFDIKDSVVFRVIGTGDIQLSGMLFNSPSSATPTVAVRGTKNTTGIKINHIGDASMYITSNYNGDFTFENLDIETASVGTESASKDYAFFYSAASATAVKMTFNSVEFHAPNAVPYNPGMFIISIGGTDSKLVIKNSGLYTNASGIYLGVMEGAEMETEVVLIEDSVISSSPKYSSARSYAIFMEKAGWTHVGMKGTVNIKNSVVESAARTLYAEFETENKITAVVNAYNSIIRTTGENGSDNAAVLARWIYFNADGTSKLGSCKSDILFAGGKGAVYGNVGLRTNFVAITETNGNGGIKFPDGEVGAGSSEEYTWLYDPLTDSSYPYVMVKIVRDEDSNIIGYVSGTVDGEDVYCEAPQPTYLRNYSFETIFLKPAGDNENLYNLLGVANSKKSYTDAELFWDNDTAGMQWDIKMGSVYRVVAGDNNYVKFVITDDTTTKFVNTVSADGKTLTSTADPYMIIGGNMKYANNLAHVRENGNYSRVNMVILDFDFGCDSDIGYPDMTTQTQARYNTAASTTTQDTFSIAPDGTVNYRSGLYDHPSDSVKLKPVGEWNHITVVFYTDPTMSVGGATDVGIAHYFLNGDYMGYSRAYGAGLDAYIMGMRFNIPKNSAQNIGATIAYDNISWKAYSDYIGGESDDGTLKYDYAKQYVVANPAEKYMSGEKFAVSGIEYKDINEAIKDAAACGTVVDLLGDVKDAVTVTVDGTVNANGYSLALSDESVACQPSYTEDGKVLSYTFNSAYNGMELTYNWYIGEVGNLEQENDPAYFVSTKVGIGQVPSYDYTYPTSYDVTTYKAIYHSGWSETGEGDGVLAPLSLSVYAAYKDTGIYLYPTFETREEAWTYYTKETSTGKILEVGRTEAEAVAAYKGLSNGETLVLLSDISLDSYVYFYTDAPGTASTGVAGVTIDDEYTEDEIETMKKAAQVLTVDLNGHVITSTKGGRIAAVSNNTVFNIYSSVSGGGLYARKLDGTTVKGERCIAIMHRSGSESKNNGVAVFNAHINAGAYTDPITGQTYPGSNMYIASGVAVEGNTGDNSCSINIDGAGVYSCVSDFTGTVMTRYYSGTITIKNSIFAAPMRTNIIDMKSYSNCDVTPYVTFENCLIINKSGAITGNNGDIENTRCLTFINCKSTNRLNPSNANRTYYGYGTAAELLPSNKLVESELVRAYCNEGMTMEGFVPAGTHYLAIRNPVYEGGKINDTDYYYYIVDYGYYDEFVKENPDVSASRIVELPILTEKLVYPDEVTTVTFESFDGTTVTQNYVIGAPIIAHVVDDGRNNVSAIANSADYELTSMKLAVTGWDIPEGAVASDNDIIYPAYVTNAKLDGIKTGISLYTDFRINLYIPEQYSTYITSISNETEALQSEVVEIEGERYIKVTISMASNEASKNAVFKVALSEEEYNASATVSISLLAYANSIITNTASAEADVKLASYMISYAKAAYEYIYGESDPAIEAIYTETDDYTDFAAVDVSALSAVFEYATVDLGNSLSYVFKVKDDFVGNVTVAGKVYAIGADSEKTIVLSGLSLLDFAKNIELKAADAEGNEVLNAAYNLASFVEYHEANAAASEASAECLALVKAFYNYVCCAVEYTTPVADESTCESHTDGDANGLCDSCGVTVETQTDSNAA